MDTEQRFWSKVDRRQERECWLWLGARKSGGYGNYWAGVEDGYQLAHRYAYRLIRGPIPDDVVLDHLCRVPACVNPAHLDPVSQHVNISVRGFSPAALNLRKTHCVNGHKFTPENTLVRSDGSGRDCRRCRADREGQHRQDPGYRARQNEQRRQRRQERA